MFGVRSDAPRSVFALKGYAATRKRGTPTLALVRLPTQRRDALESRL